MIAIICKVTKYTQGHVPHANQYPVECMAPGVVLPVRFERTVSVCLANEWNLVLQCGLLVWLFAVWGYSLAFCSVELWFGFLQCRVTV